MQFKLFCYKLKCINNLKTFESLLTKNKNIFKGTLSKNHPVARAKNTLLLSTAKG